MKFKVGDKVTAQALIDESKSIIYFLLPENEENKKEVKAVMSSSRSDDLSVSLRMGLYWEIKSVYKLNAVVVPYYRLATANPNIDILLSENHLSAYKVDKTTFKFIRQINTELGEDALNKFTEALSQRFRPLGQEYRKYNINFVEYA